METYYVTETRGWALYSEPCIGHQWKMPWVKDYDLSRAVYPRVKEKTKMQPPGSAEGFKVLNSPPPDVLLWFSFFFLRFLFLIWIIFKVFIEFVTILHLFYVLDFWPQGMWELNSLTRDRTCTLCIGRWSLNHWTTWEVPASLMLPEFFS